MVDSIRDILRQHARLNRDASDIDENADLYSLGLTSHAGVTLMLALEDAFDTEFPERMLRRRTFETIGNIREALTELGARPRADAR
jgi:acyl carrier protein